MIFLKYKKNPKPTAAQMAVVESSKRLDDARADWPEVAEQAIWHRLRRDQNHFARDFELLLKGGSR